MIRRSNLAPPMLSSYKENAPDVWLEDGRRLDVYGVAGRIMHIPGHTAGSISVVLDDGQAIVGDVLMGGYWGGNLLARRPNWHYFAQDFSQTQASLVAILETGAHTLYIGHGGPLTAAAVQQRFGQAR